MSTVSKTDEFEGNYAVEHCYASNGPDKGPIYPPLPKPSFMIDGVPLWSRDLVIEYGKAVERCSPACFDYSKGKKC